MQSSTLRLALADCTALHAVNSSWTSMLGTLAFAPNSAMARLESGHDTRSNKVITRDPVVVQITRICTRPTRFAQSAVCLCCASRCRALTRVSCRRDTPRTLLNSFEQATLLWK